MCAQSPLKWEKSFNKISHVAQINLLLLNFTLTFRTIFNSLLKRLSNVLF